MMSLKSPNQTLETNRRPRSPLGAGQEFERAIYDPAFLSGGGRSAFCWASTCVAGVDAAVFAGHAFVCPTPTPLSVSDALADGLWLEIESPSASCVVLGLDALAVGPLR